MARSIKSRLTFEVRLLLKYGSTILLNTIILINIFDINGCI